MMKFSVQMLALAVGVESRATRAPPPQTGPFTGPTSVAARFFDENTLPSVPEKRSSPMERPSPMENGLRECKRTKSDDKKITSSELRLWAVIRYLLADRSQRTVSVEDRVAESVADALDEKTPAVETPAVETSLPKSLQDVYARTALAAGPNYRYVTSPTLEECVDDVVKKAEEIYKSVLGMSRSGPLTIVSPGQSPSYVALAMINLPIYDPKKVDVVVLPLSKLHVDWDDRLKEQEWMQPYCQHLRKEGIQIRRRRFGSKRPIYVCHEGVVADVSFLE